MPADRTANNQTGGSTMNTALVDDEQKRIARQQELGDTVSGTSVTSGPATIGGSSATQSSPTVKTMPKQQKAGTGTFANLKSYLQAAQGGGQQKVAEAATQQVQRLGTGAQKGVQQAQQAFGRQMEAGSLKGMETAGQEAQNIIGTARSTTYQAPQAQPQTETQTQPQVQAEPKQYFTPEQQQRFAEIINAQYQGPQSLQQAGLYEQAARKAKTAQQAGELTQTALGREQLLKDVFGRNRDYSRGASRLDALLLNASEQGVQQLQQQAQPAIQAQQALQTAQNLSANEAAQRRAAIEGIRSGARTAFTEARTAEETSVENRIKSLIETPVTDAEGKVLTKADGTPMTEWDRLPEYFRQSLANKGEANKQIQEEGIKNLEQTTGLSAKRFEELPNQIASLQQSIEQLKAKQDRVVKGPYGNISIPNPQAREQLQKAMQDLDALNAEYASYSDFGNQLAGIKSINANQWVLSPEEAAVLGISAGEGLYNIRPEDIRTTQAERSRLITKDELTRQLALAQLAGTDISNQLQKDLMYSDLEKAGTQDLTKSLDVEALRKLLNESQAGFKTAAEAANLTGTGEKKVSRGNIFGKKTKTYGATVEGNVADMLRQAGYDVGSETPSAARSLLTDKDLLNRYLEATRTSRSTDSNIGGSAIEGTASGAGTGAAIGSIVPGVGTGIGAAVGATVGGMAGANTTDQLQYYTDLAKEMEDKLGIKGLGAVGQGVQDVRSGAGGIFTGAGTALGSNVFGDIFRGIGGAVGGINTGAMKAYGEAIAKDIAIEDLKNKYSNWLQGQGFENRANIANTETTRARTAALLDLLRRQG